MTREDRIYSRERAYLFLGDIFLHGLSPANAVEVSENPVLAEYISLPVDADFWDSEYQRIFGFNAQPYASVFLGEDGYLGGAISDTVGRTYRNAGFFMSDEGMVPDHLGDELLFMAHLMKKQQAVLHQGREDELTPVESLVGSFLNHLLSWLPQLAQSLQRLDNEFYAALASLALELVVDHAGDMPLLNAPHGKVGGESTVEGERELARFFTRPNRCGFYIGREQIAGIGRRIDVPTGFIEREQMLLNVIEGARRYDAIPALIEELNELIDSCRAFYDAMLPPAYADRFGIRLSQSKHILQNLP